MWRQSIPTSYRLWAAIAIGLFVAAGCVDWWPTALGMAYWPACARFLAETANSLIPLFIWGLLMAAQSIILAWMGQALVQVFARSLRKRRAESPPRG